MKFDIDLDSPETTGAAPASAAAPLVPGDQIHALASLTISIAEGSAGGAQLDYGQTMTITAEILELNRDRLGNSIFDLIDEPEAQEAKFGRIVIARGPFPAHLPRHPRGSAEAMWAAEQARTSAAKIADDGERAAAQKRIRDEFGMPSTQRSIALYGGF